MLSSGFPLQARAAALDVESQQHAVGVGCAARFDPDTVEHAKERPRAVESKAGSDWAADGNGLDLRTPVDDKDYQVPFKFTGKINKLTIKVERPKLTPEDIKQLEAAQRNNRMSE